jgi:hypothetical protein
LQVDALARGVGGDEDAQGVLLWVGVEGVLDLLAGVVAHAAVEGADAMLGLVGGLEGGAELVYQVALGVRVFGEDQDAAIEPGCAGLAEAWAGVLFEPGEQAAHPGVGGVAGGLGDLGHGGQQGALLGGRGCGAAGEQLELGGVLAGDLFFRELGAVVVGAWSFGQVGGFAVGGSGLFVDRPAVHGEGAGEGLDRGEQALL